MTSFLHLILEVIFVSSILYTLTVVDFSNSMVDQDFANVFQDYAEILVIFLFLRYICHFVSNDRHICAMTSFMRTMKLTILDESHENAKQSIKRTYYLVKVMLIFVPTIIVYKYIHISALVSALTLGILSILSTILMSETFNRDKAIIKILEVTCIVIHLGVCSYLIFGQLWKLWFDALVLGLVLTIWRIVLLILIYPFDKLAKYLFSKSSFNALNQENLLEAKSPGFTRFKEIPSPVFQLMESEAVAEPLVQNKLSETSLALLKHEELDDAHQTVFKLMVEDDSENFLVQTKLDEQILRKFFKHELNPDQHQQSLGDILSHDQKNQKQGQLEHNQAQASKIKQNIQGKNPILMISSEGEPFQDLKNQKQEQVETTQKTISSSNNGESMLISTEDVHVDQGKCPFTVDVTNKEQSESQFPATKNLIKEKKFDDIVDTDFQKQYTDIHAEDQKPDIGNQYNTDVPSHLRNDFENNAMKKDFELDLKKEDEQLRHYRDETTKYTNLKTDCPTELDVPRSDCTLINGTESGNPKIIVATAEVIKEDKQQSMEFATECKLPITKFQEINCETTNQHLNQTDVNNLLSPLNQNSKKRNSSANNIGELIEFFERASKKQRYQRSSVHRNSDSKIEYKLELWKRLEREDALVEENKNKVSGACKNTSVSFNEGNNCDLKKCIEHEKLCSDFPKKHFSLMNEPDFYFEDQIGKEISNASSNLTGFQFKTYEEISQKGIVFDSTKITANFEPSEHLALEATCVSTSQTRERKMEVSFGKIAPESRQRDNSEDLIVLKSKCGNISDTYYKSEKDKCVTLDLKSNEITDFTTIDSNNFTVPLVINNVSEESCMKNKTNQLTNLEAESGKLIAASCRIPVELTVQNCESKKFCDKNKSEQNILDFKPDKTAASGYNSTIPDITVQEVQPYKVLESTVSSCRLNMKDIETCKNSDRICDENATKCSQTNNIDEYSEIVTSSYRNAIDSDRRFMPEVETSNTSNIIHYNSKTENVTFGMVASCQAMISSCELAVQGDKCTKMCDQNNQDNKSDLREQAVLEAVSNDKVKEYLLIESRGYSNIIVKFLNTDDKQIDFKEKRKSKCISSVDNAVNEIDLRFIYAVY